MALREVSAALAPVARKLGRELNPVVYGAAEFKKKARAGHHFIKRMLEDKKVFLVGGAHELEILAG